LPEARHQDRSRRAVITGLGHARHKPIDPRTPRPLPVNGTGAIGALCCELGFDWRIARGIAVIGRAVGLVGHLAEEIRQPIAREIHLRAEDECSTQAQKIQGGLMDS
jgi:citrate synthase